TPPVPASATTRASPNGPAARPTPPSPGPPAGPPRSWTPGRPRAPGGPPHPGFGTFRDGSDVTFVPDDEDEWDREWLLLDINLIATADPMPPRAAPVLAACAASSDSRPVAPTHHP